jgi:hypothetical protein
MIARRERPCYRIAETGDGSTVYIVELPWIEAIPATRATAVRRAHDAVAAWLDVDPGAFDIERE